MENWQKRMLHHRAIVDAECAMANIEKPAHPVNGVANPTTVIRKYIGPVFWKHFESSGHSSAEFDKCKCKCKHKS